MLFALLFNGRDELIAAAPAVFQYSIGDDYWHDTYADKVNVDSDCQTGYVEVTDADLIDKLNSLETDDAHLIECRKRVTGLISVTSRPGKRPRAA